VKHFSNVRFADATCTAERQQPYVWPSQELRDCLNVKLTLNEWRERCRKSVPDLIQSSLDNVIFFVLLMIEETVDS
jgi:hypothetical protein